MKLQYFEHGTGPEQLVLVHGYRSSGRIWRLVQEALDPTRFRSLALSNRGAGDSERTAAEADYTVDVKGLSSTYITGADIHRGGRGLNGPVVKHLADGGFIVIGGHIQAQRWGPPGDGLVRQR